MSGSGSIAIEAGTGTVVGRSLLARKIVHVQDVQADPDYTLARAGGLGSFRTVLAVPMLREGAAIGVLALTRSELRPFTDKQVRVGHDLCRPSCNRERAIA